MKRLPLFTFVLLTSIASTSVFAAPSNWGNSGNKLMASAEKHIEAKNYDAAIGDLKQRVSSNPNDADAYNLLGYTHRKTKRYGLAEEYYQRALQLNPKHKGALEYLGELYVETDRMDEASEMLGRLDKACFFECEQYTTLKAMIETKKDGAGKLQQSSESWSF